MKIKFDCAKMLKGYFALGFMFDKTEPKSFSFGLSFIKYVVSFTVTWGGTEKA